MLSRSLLRLTCRQNKLQTITKPCLQRVRPPVVASSLHQASVDQCVSHIHTSTIHCNDEEVIGKAQAKIRAKKKLKISKDAEDKTAEDELATAAVEAARSLPGDWAKTANELMKRLAMHDVKESVKDEESPVQQTKPLLSEMQVERRFEKRKTQGLRQTTNDPKNYGFKDGDDGFPRKRTQVSRSQQMLTKVYSQPPLGIFDPKLYKESQDDLEEVETVTDLWHEKDMDDLRKAKGALPRNAFEEMIQWTKEGKMWTYPVDNEEDMHEERKYQFHEHIFLERHLGPFPSQGPLRRFMELVVIGLSKNAWLSVPEKIEHIQGFADYFREKQSLLEPTLGEQANLKDVES